MSAVQAQLWRSVRRRRGRQPYRPPESSQSLEAIDRGLQDLVARQFPDLWEDLSDEGRDMFVRGLLEAAARPPEDRDQAGVEVVDSWYQAWGLLYAPLDDEPYTAEEQAEDAAALERLQRGEGVPLDGLLPRGRRNR